ncbi:hypothetical protein HAX54_017683, partial [Datura stramonium]|nr:hypothetical protein [Datura stramonium]
ICPIHRLGGNRSDGMVLVQRWSRVVGLDFPVDSDERRSGGEVIVLVKFLVPVVFVGPARREEGKGGWRRFACGRWEEGDGHDGWLCLVVVLTGKKWEREMGTTAVATAVERKQRGDRLGLLPEIMEVWTGCRSLQWVVRRECRGEKKVRRWTLFFRRCSDWWLWRFPVERGKARSEGKRERERSAVIGVGGRRRNRGREEGGWAAV